MGGWIFSLKCKDSLYFGFCPCPCPYTKSISLLIDRTLKFLRSLGLFWEWEYIGFLIAYTFLLIECSAVFGSFLKFYWMFLTAKWLYEVFLSSDIFSETVFFKFIFLGPSSKISFSYCFSCLSNPKFGQMLFLLALTIPMASLKPIFLDLIKYAITRVADYIREKILLKLQLRSEPELLP